MCKDAISIYLQFCKKEQKRKMGLFLPLRLEQWDIDFLWLIVYQFATEELLVLPIYKCR